MRPALSHGLLPAASAVRGRLSCWSPSPPEDLLNPVLSPQRALGKVCREEPGSFNSGASSRQFALKARPKSLELAQLGTKDHLASISRPRAAAHSCYA